jgi:hypothetical protein
LSHFILQSKREKYYGGDAWDDVLNFEMHAINNILMPTYKDCDSKIEVLGIDIKCGTPLLEIKNKLRINGYKNVTLSAFAQEAKYWMDLKSICEGHVSCNGLGNIDK